MDMLVRIIFIILCGYVYKDVFIIINIDNIYNNSLTAYAVRVLVVFQRGSTIPLGGGGVCGPGLPGMEFSVRMAAFSR